MTEFALAELLARLDSLEAQTDAWDEAQRDTLFALREATDQLNREAWRRLLQALNEDRGSAARMRELAGDEVVYAVLRRHGLLRPSLDERIQAALEPVRPLLHAHGGDVEVVEIRLPDTLLVRMTGACEGCPASAVTLAAGVVRAVRTACPEIRRVLDISGEGEQTMPQDTVSPFAGDE